MPDLSHLSPCIWERLHLSHLSYMGEVVGGGGSRTSSPDTTDPGTANLGTRAERPFSWIPAHTRTRTWATTQTTQTAPQGPGSAARWYRWRYHGGSGRADPAGSEHKRRPFEG